MYDLIAIAIFMFFAYLFGQIGEKRHYKSIREREKALMDIPVVTQRWKKAGKSLGKEVDKSSLVSGHVVMGVDSFRVFLGGILSIFGGRIKPYESMLDRARREAILRAKEKAKSADMFFNIRLESSRISRGAIEIIAYATAVKFK